MNDSSTVQSTDPSGNPLDDLPASGDGTQVGRANFHIEGTPRHIVVDDCPAPIIRSRNVTQGNNVSRRDRGPCLPPLEAPLSISGSAQRQQRLSRIRARTPHGTRRSDMKDLTNVVTANVHTDIVQSQAM